MMIRRSTQDDHGTEFSVGRFRVRPDEGLVIDGDRTSRLEPQVMALLVYLADNARRVVSRDELLREVWGGTAVTDGAITRCVAVIRRALDARESGDPIRTIPKRGYQWILAVKREPARAKPVLSRARWGRWAVAALILVVIAGGVHVLRLGTPRHPVSVTVEPFEDLDGLAQQEQWGRSVTEELIAGLLATPGLTVVASDDDAPRSGVVLSGSVRREGDTARLYCQLIDNRTREVIQAGTCTIPAAPRLEIQAQWAGAMAQGIGAALR